MIFALTTRLLRNNNNNIFHPSRRSSLSIFVFFHIHLLMHIP
ncbi:unnamed protein product [Brugia timori]|uniref:Uncharacterized protein n=1 Tax=Brugia timori TaxID=42155 RepID=A0A3P7TML2_9BILA|nr:unnamed protein product [Brugia timori]